MRGELDDPGFGLTPGEVRLVHVDGTWSDRFASERAMLLSALGAGALDIQHIGSTAVPGMLAKPILDIGVAIRSFEAGVPLVPLVVGCGYEYRGEHGIPRRHYFVKGEPRRTHHLHMLEAESDDWTRHLAFRDALRGSPALAAEYSQLKRSIVAQVGGDRERYQALKESFISRCAACPGS